MKLSIIIVNYNVKYFLEQCLLSVQKASGAMIQHNPDFSSEIIVVDNNSVDSSVQLLKEKFHGIRTILNNENLGYSKANNQAIKISRGEYVLLLNPDTVVEESTFIKIIEFADSKPDLGGLGVRMLDGRGNFLPESKRGLPTPMTSLYKITGLSRIFPKSKTFGKYHLKYLDEYEISEVDILSGAFMLLKKSVLNQTGLLDENFFMYGEDIDLSYRITKAGFKNYYFPDTQIIHYKGESTKKGSLNYVYMFYRAMIIFTRKHFSVKHASLFSVFINLAIVLRAGLSLTKRFVLSLALPLVDGLLIFGGLFWVKIFWENNEKIGHGVPYPRDFVLFIFPLYCLLWVMGLLVTKNYLKPFRVKNILKGVLLGTLLISTLYAFFEESFRFSRAIIILGTLTTFASALLSRFLFNAIKYRSFSFVYSREIKLAIVGSVTEAQHVMELLRKSGVNIVFTGYIYNSKEEVVNPELKHLSTTDKIEEIVDIYKINELIFCSKDISSTDTIDMMTRLNKKDVAFKIAPHESVFVIGSRGKNQSGDYYTIDIELAVSKAENRFNKRMFDITASLAFILFSPVLLIFQNSISKYFSSCFQVLYGKKTWIGYFETKSNYSLPKIRAMIFPPVIVKQQDVLSEEYKDEMNLIYAQKYEVLTDMYLVMKNIKHLGD